MVIIVLPILKLAILGMRQVARPVSNFIRKEAKQSKFFRDYICMPPAQGFHWCEITIKMLLMNLGRPAKVEPLNQAMAIELGAEILGELIVFIIAAGGLIFETARQAKKKNLEMSSINVHSLELVEALKVLEYRQKRQKAYIEEITHALAELNEPITVKKIKMEEFRGKQEELFKNVPVEYLFD